MSEITISVVPAGSTLLDQVWKLYRKNSGVLGFLPRGALEEFAQRGWVMAAMRGDALLGYVAWRRSWEESVLVHLCVSRENRGSSCSKLLLTGLIEQCHDDAAIRLRCRKDYDVPNRLWPRYGFAVESEVRGRAIDAVPLLIWRRVNRENAPILQLIRDATPRALHVIAIDANVFFDVMVSSSPYYEESRALLSEWLDDVDVCVTRELRNELARQPDDEKRRAGQVFMQRFRELAGHPDQLDEALAVIGGVLPPPTCDSDHSDRRQLAHAYLEQAKYFATRDEVLLDHAEDLRAAIGLSVLRPSEVVARLHGDFLGSDYAPVRLQGTRIVGRSVDSENELLPFQRFAMKESRAEWLRIVRAARAAADRVTIKVFGAPDEPPRVATAVERVDSARLHIRFLRALSAPITGTLLRRVIANLMEEAHLQGRNRLTIQDPGAGEVREALEHLGFEAGKDGLLARYAVAKLVERSVARAIVSATLPTVALAETECEKTLETRFWPLKVLGAGIETYIVPIQAYWAAALFDRHLAGQDLFGVPDGPALALENVYFSASAVHIPEGSRILWYVSGEGGAVRAVSVCLGTDADSATLLSRRHHRLGVYRWREVLGAAHGDPHKTLRAYKFARTELMTKPLPWKRLEDLIWRHMGTRNRVQSPLRVPENLFVEAYRVGMERPV